MYCTFLFKTAQSARAFSRESALYERLIVTPDHNSRLPAFEWHDAPRWLCSQGARPRGSQGYAHYHIVLRYFSTTYVATIARNNWRLIFDYHSLAFLVLHQQTAPLYLSTRKYFNVLKFNSYFERLAWNLIRQMSFYSALHFDVFTCSCARANRRPWALRAGPVWIIHLPLVCKKHFVVLVLCTWNIWQR